MSVEDQITKLQAKTEELTKSYASAQKETHEQVKARVAKAHAYVQSASESANRSAAAISDKAGVAKDDAAAKWDQLRSGVSGHVNDLRAKVEAKKDEFDATSASIAADNAESDAEAAIDFASWAIDNAVLAALNAVDARAYAESFSDS